MAMITAALAVFFMFLAINTLGFPWVMIRLKIKYQGVGAEILRQGEHFYINKGMVRANPDKRGLRETRELSNQFYEEMEL